jgi:hypothetical protein
MTNRTPQPGPAELAADLRALLAEYGARYEELHGHAIGQREALRRADAAGVEREATLQAAVLAQIAVLDRRRDELINAAAAVLPGLAGPNSGPVSLGRIAAALPAAGAGELVAAAGRLRALVRQTSDLMRSLGQASRSLVTHFEGLMRQVDRYVSHAGVYGRRGIVEAGPAVVSSLDLRT